MKTIFTTLMLASFCSVISAPAFADPEREQDLMTRRAIQNGQYNTQFADPAYRYQYGTLPSPYTNYWQLQPNGQPVQDGPRGSYE
jgi:hypothetical protein